MSNTALLQINDLSCIRDDRVLFEHLSLSLDGGQMLLVEGRNGSGKTSLLRILTGLKLADAGDIFWQGQSITRLGADYYEAVNYVGHHDGIKRELTCLENLRLVQAMGKPAPIELDDALEQVLLYRYGDTPVGNLSAGQKRRLALARLLVTESKLWILDEPFTSLDKKSMDYFQGVFEQHIQNQGMVVMTSHHEMVMPGPSLKRLNLSE
ncbi:MAG: cytochrome c biogenesis heme-transporting ATPase CcmA [Gammaproteobacteria bacterium]|nr:cytochrome c biogenesis heme-transporting ATPase CcmA [Gammaproteobacteria bacterium]